ncbi:MAG: amidohydrolase family protein [Bacteroidales bacterium]|nr:amidohydrolase family protein [Bacteroidales bacterium]
MRHFSAHYILTNSGPPLKRGIITTGDDGTILNIEETTGALRERSSLEFHNGIIVPGFVNCHTHLELSYLKGRMAVLNGLSDFIRQLQAGRRGSPEEIRSSMRAADDEMLKEGIVLCGDICNTAASFPVKMESRISYVNFLEVFGTDPLTARDRMDEAEPVQQTAASAEMPCYMVPHSVYSVSLPMFRLLREKSWKNKVTTIHFMETQGEKEFIENRRGPLMTLYREAGISAPPGAFAPDHAAAVLREITPSGNLILVHNTFADRAAVKAVMERGSLYWCLCPNSNLFIEKSLPPLDLLAGEGCQIVTGTDSLASNSRLSILDELKTLQKHFPQFTLEEMIRWATINGARALGEEDRFGRIVPGTRPGLLLIGDADLVNMRLSAESRIVRLI